MTIWEEEAVIGNPGYRQYRYRVVWKGDTVVRMLAVGEPAKTGYSDFDSRRVEGLLWEGRPRASLSAGAHAHHRRSETVAASPG